MRSLPTAQYLIVLALVFFLWGCAAPPAKTPERDIDASTGARQVKNPDSQNKKPKKKAGEKSKEVVGKKEQSAASPTDPAMETQAEDESVVGRMFFYYEYFPNTEVYYDTIRHLYFYQENSKWIMSVALPTAFQKNAGLSVRLKLPTAYPYSLHQEHRSAYPPGPDHRGF